MSSVLFLFFLFCSTISLSHARPSLLSGLGLLGVLPAASAVCYFGFDQGIFAMFGGKMMLFAIISFSVLFSIDVFMMSFSLFSRTQCSRFGTVAILFLRVVVVSLGVSSR